MTSICLWNRLWHGIVIAGYGCGHIRIYTIPDGDIVAEVAAHAGWITSMDLASQSGFLLSVAEDGFVRVSETSTVHVHALHIQHNKLFASF